MIPVNLRTTFHRDIPAANIVGSVFLDRRPSEAVDSAELLRGIDGQMDRINWNQLGRTFLYSLQILHLLPGGLASQNRSDRCQVSTVLSNLGRVLTSSPLPRDDSERLVVGDATLESIEVLAPNRPSSCVSFVAINDANRLSILLHYDDRVVQGGDAHRLMEIFVDHLCA